MLKAARHQPPGTLGATLVAHRRWQSALPTQNAVQQRHHTRCVRAVGFTGAPSSARLALVARAGRDNGKEAHDLLSPFYYWFTEGFDTKDLKEGKALLDKLEL
jgi:predicted ATPase